MYLIYIYIYMRGCDGVHQLGVLPEPLDKRCKVGISCMFMLDFARAKKNNLDVSGLDQVKCCCFPLENNELLCNCVL